MSDTTAVMKKKVSLRSVTRSLFYPHHADSNWIWASAVSSTVSPVTSKCQWLAGMSMVAPPVHSLGKSIRHLTAFFPPGSKSSDCSIHWNISVAIGVQYPACVLNLHTLISSLALGHEFSEMFRDIKILRRIVFTNRAWRKKICNRRQAKLCSSDCTKKNQMQNICRFRHVQTRKEDKIEKWRPGRKSENLNNTTGAERPTLNIESERIGFSCHKWFTMSLRLKKK